VYKAGFLNRHQIGFAKQLVDVVEFPQDEASGAGGALAEAFAVQVRARTHTEPV